MKVWNSPPPTQTFDVLVTIGQDRKPTTKEKKNSSFFYSFPNAQKAIIFNTCICKFESN